MNKLKLVTKKINQIKPYFNNPRLNELSIPEAMESIKAFGYNNPITVDEDFVIVTGHTRYAAIVRLGWKEVPVIVLEHLNSDKAKAYRILDNKVGEKSRWDQEKLTREVAGFTKDLGEIFMPIFPELKPVEIPDIKVSLGNVSPDSLKKAEDDLNNKFKKSKTMELVTVACPHCGETFEIDV